MGSILLLTGTDFVGKAIVVAENNQTKGHVSDIVVDHKKRSLIALLFGNGKIKDRRAVSYDDIVEIVEDTIFVKSDINIKKADKVVKIPDQKSAQLTQSKVKSKDGSVIGELTDLYFDPETGKIVNIEYRKNGQAKRVDIDSVQKIKAEEVVISDKKSSKKQDDGAKKKLKKAAKTVKKEIKETAKEAKEALS